MIGGFVGLDKIRSQEEYDALAKSALEERHGLFLPTHILRKNVTDGPQKNVGYFSVGAPGATIVFGWLSQKEMHARESFHLLNNVEDMVMRADSKLICMPMPKHSPFHPLMRSMGYKSAGEYEFFIKPL